MKYCTAFVSAALIFIACIHIPSSIEAADVNQGTQEQDSAGICSRPGFIDAHCHLYVQHNPKKETFINRDSYDDAAKAAVENMNSLGISVSIVMPPPFVNGQPGKYDYDTFCSSIKKYPGRFAFFGGGGLLNPMIHENESKADISEGVKASFKDRAERILADGASGFGEITFEHFSIGENHPYEHASPDNPLMLLLADIAAKHDVPVDIHMEALPEDMPLPEREKVKTGPNPEELKENIRAFERLLSYNPRTNIIWAHAGWCNTGKRTVELMDGLLERNPNLFMSIKISPESIPEMRPFSRPGEIKPEWLGLLKKYPDRFIVGSDEFYQSSWASGGKPVARTGIIKKFIDSLPLELKSKIGCENAARLLKR
jgi:predicted TIM-barrel fold metal-dependent hydrolase